LQLRRDHIQRAPGLALRARFTDAHDRHQSRAPCGLRFRTHLRIGLMMILPALGMADDHSRRAGILQHFGGDVAGEGPRGERVTILSADQNRRAAGCRRKAHNQRRRRTDHQIHLR
jgi:hypothetical protein